MLLTKLITVLQALDGDSIERLDDYIHSRYFKVPAGSVVLFEFLKPLHPTFSERKLNAKSLGKFSKNLSTPAKQARAGTELLESIEYFLSLEDWQTNHRDVAYHLFKNIRQLNLHGLFDKDYEKMIWDLHTCPEQNIDTFYYKHLFTELSFSGFDAVLKRTTQNDLSPMLKSLDAFYAIKQLRYLCEVVSRKQVLGTSYNEQYISFILNMLEPYANENHPYVYLYYNVYLMLVEEDFERSKPCYKSVKEFLKLHSVETLSDSYAEAIGYCVSWTLKWNTRGEIEASSEYLWWIELKIRLGLLIENGKLQPITYRNVVVMAVSSKAELLWTETFVKTYSPFLPEDNRETNKAFAEGLLSFQRKQYTEAIHFFLTAQAKDEAIFNGLIRRCQYMSYYEMDPSDTDMLLNQLSAFVKYLNRHLQEFHQFKNGFVKFIDYSKKILQLRVREESRSLVQELAGEEYFPGKPWLIEKINERYC